MKTVYILGRQPKLGLAELEAVYGVAVSEISPGVVIVDAPLANQPIGSAVKTAQLLTSFPAKSWQDLSNKVTQYLTTALPADGKVTLGLSIYGHDVHSQQLQSIGLALKRQRKKAGQASLRLIPNQNPALNSAQVLHNKLTSDNKWELLIISTAGGETLLAKTIAVQDITAYTKRDRGRPRRDARVGMLPPKLAQTMINLASTQTNTRLLDPFCGTGVVLQEAALMGYKVYGTDLEERMINYSEDNLHWLMKTYRAHFDWQLQQGDATNTTWQPPIDLVVAETYLGRPFTSEPSGDILQKTIADCNIIIKKFLQNIASQVKPGTKFCLAVPAWFVNNKLYRLTLLDDLRNIGYNRLDFKHASHDDLIYHREGQIVGRELLVLTRR